MSMVDDAKRELTLDNLKLPNLPKIVRLEVNSYVDYHGEDALEVWLILDESTTEEQLNGEAVWAIQEAILDRIKLAGIELYPYFRLAKQSELDELNDSPEDC